MYWQASMDLTPAFLSQVFLKHNQQWTPWILCFSSVVGIHGLVHAKHAVHAWATSPALCIFFLCFIYTSPSHCTHHLCRKSGPVSSHILWADQAWSICCICNNFKAHSSDLRPSLTQDLEETGKPHCACWPAASLWFILSCIFQSNFSLTWAH